MLKGCAVKVRFLTWFIPEWLHAAVASNNKDSMLLSAPEAEYTVSLASKPIAQLRLLACIRVSHAAEHG